MSEKDFITELIDRLNLQVSPCVIDTHRPLLYDLSIDDDGQIRMGVDKDSGEPIRGRGKGFEQDILIFDNPEGRDAHVVPRVVAEVKFVAVTTHDVIVYSEKARRIRNVYRYVRYGLILGGFDSIPGRVLRLGAEFDFVLAISYPLEESDLKYARQTLIAEVSASRDFARIARGQNKIVAFRRSLQMLQNHE